MKRIFTNEVGAVWTAEWSEGTGVGVGARADGDALPERTHTGVTFTGPEGEIRRGEIAFGTRPDEAALRRALSRSK